MKKLIYKIFGKEVTIKITDDNAKGTWRYYRGREDCLVTSGPLFFKVEDGEKYYFYMALVLKRK